MRTRGGVEDTRLEDKAKDTKKSEAKAKDTKKSEAEAKAKDSLSEDRHSRGQGQECSRPRPRTKDASASALQKKKVFTKIFQAISTKKRFLKNFSSAPQNFNNSKNTAVLEPRTGQFSRTWGLEAKDLTFEAKAKDFKMCPRGQGRSRGLHLWWEPKKKRSSSPTFHEIRCESTKTTKKHFLLANSRTISTNLGVLGLDLHSSSPERVNFFGAQASLGRARPWNAPRGAGPHWWALEAGFKGPVLPLLNSS